MFIYVSPLKRLCSYHFFKEENYKRNYVLKQIMIYVHNIKIFKEKISELYMLSHLLFFFARSIYAKQRMGNKYHVYGYHLSPFLQIYSVGNQIYNIIYTTLYEMVNKSGLARFSQNVHGHMMAYCYVAYTYKIDSW